ncbi:class I SAM-dependent methyltransferase [uncultured Draconibacterium sp.]|uniref:class I SAM-dependent methyltransferase n=1 Tax=uncultured Draconibacterium sp. TaxID=1573823 RepID=UPI0029C837F6|nr:class I SAM-dependent methyltransferase [uncultured Draconibacterium sp.]
MKQVTCLSCNSENVEDFFTVKNAPVQSVLTVKTYDEAIAVPKNDITLTFCNNCGFIFNSTFDTGIDYYTKGYEDQQGFSGRFVEFITAISNQLIKKYDVENKNIVEIGCGKGEFLQLICKLGNNKGIGIDPAYVPGRLEPNPNVRFINEFYSEKHGDLPMDVIVCRHTLEHIYKTNNFIHTIRTSVKNKKKVTVFIEVPNITRILDICAFWDIFNEHCSYFSAGSLAKLLRLNKFEVLDIQLEYDNQYLLLVAQTTDRILDTPHELEESIDELKSYLQKFVVTINKQLAYWRKQLQQMKTDNKKVVIWGGGSKSVGFLTQVDDLKLIKHVVDINPHIQGNYIPGIGIQYVSPKNLLKIVPDTVIVMNGIYKDEIGKMLSDMNLEPELICL